MNNYHDLTKQNLIKIALEKDQTIKALEEKVEHLTLSLAMQKANKFSKKSEVMDQEDANLFNYNEVEAISTTTLESEIQQINHKKPRKAKSKNHEAIDFEKFVTKTIIHTPISDDEKSNHEKISEDIIYKAHVNVSIEVTKHIYETYKKIDSNQLTTDLRDFPFNNSIATPSMVSYIANEKYLMGTPLYRQESAFLSMGFPLSRVDLSNYLIKGAAMLYPIYAYMKYLLIHNPSKVIHSDDTTLKVIKVGDKPSKDKCYMWLYATSKHDVPIYIYEYRYSRSGQWPKAFLADFKGYLICDDYAGYNHIPNVKLQKCLVHARRKYVDIFKANKDPKIKDIINLMDAVFDDERAFRKENLSRDDLKEKRNEKAHLAKINGYFDHIEKLNYAPTSITGKAINYSVKNKVELVRYLEDGYLSIDNNLAERGIKPFVINRKNFLFSNTEKGAEASSIYMSMIQTAKANGLDTIKYLEHLFNHMYKIKLSEHELKDPKKLILKFKEMDQFLPWHEDIKKQFKVKEVSR